MYRFFGKVKVQIKELKFCPFNLGSSKSSEIVKLQTNSSTGGVLNIKSARQNKYANISINRQKWKMNKKV